MAFDNFFHFIQYIVDVNGVLFQPHAHNYNRSIAMDTDKSIIDCIRQSGSSYMALLYVMYLCYKKQHESICVLSSTHAMSRRSHRVLCALFNINDHLFDREKIIIDRYSIIINNVTIQFYSCASQVRGRIFDKIICVMDIQSNDILSMIPVYGKHYCIMLNL